jgi:4-hydroxy-tetrahydrodipicolinate synthase
MNKLSGVFAANVTPFEPATLAVDHDWMARHIAYLRAHGCDGIVPLGTNGEGPAMSVGERKQVIDGALAAAGGMAVMPGTGCASLTDTIELTRYAFQAGADAVLIIPPFFFKNVASAGVLAYYRRLFDAALQPGQRALLYHFPRMSAVPITDDVVEGLALSHPDCVAGIKDSSGDLDSVLHWNRLFPDLRIFAGSDTLAHDAYAGGAAGTITAAGNLVPHLIQAVRQATIAGLDAAGPQASLNVVRGWLEQSGSMHAATKFLLTLFAGLPATALRPPLLELDDDQRARLAASAGQFLAQARPEAA